jgi:DNA-directed RNA polymerase subunit RPC12/RpoP
MNQIRFDCPGCGQTIETEEEAQFERVKCPTCQHEFFPDKTRFVQPAPAAPPPEPASPAPTPPIQQRVMKLINCPACGLQISPQAASCPGCGHPVTSSPLPTPLDTRQRGTAIFSLVLGILSLLCFGILTGIPAIILGHKAHGRARKLPAQYAGGGMAIAGFILGYISIPLSLVIAAFMFIQKAEMDDSHHRAQIINSENNLKQIGLAFRLWAGDHNDQFPFNVSQAQGGTSELCEPDSNGFEKNPVPIFMVMSNELATTRILVCPNDNTKQAASDFSTLTTSNISYQLRTGTNLNESHPAEILAIDSINGIVLYCDGTVQRDFHYIKTVTNQ